jgi:hypothetical protein
VEKAYAKFIQYLPKLWVCARNVHIWTTIFRVFFRGTKKTDSCLGRVVAYLTLDISVFAYHMCLASQLMIHQVSALDRERVAVALDCEKICGRQTFLENQRDPTSQSKSGSNGLPLGAFDSSGYSHLMSIVRSMFMNMTAIFSLSSVTITEIHHCSTLWPTGPPI